MIGFMIDGNKRRRERSRLLGLKGFSKRPLMRLLKIKNNPSWL